MRFVAIDSSPRRQGNTASILASVIEEMLAQGHSVQIHRLYDLKFKGCLGCFACKRSDGPSYGRCALRDDLCPVFEKIKASDGLLLASPIYFRDVTGEMRSFLERLFFQNMTYSAPPSSILERKLPVALICTMNVPEERFRGTALETTLRSLVESLETVLGPASAWYGFRTSPLESYAGIEYSYLPPEERAYRRDVVMPALRIQAREFAQGWLTEFVQSIP